jgi:hypothetical protein
MRLIVHFGFHKIVGNRFADSYREAVAAFHA